MRQARSQPLVEALFAWFTVMAPRMMAGSDTGSGMNYALKRPDGMTAFLRDGRIELDNNTAERAQKCTVRRPRARR